MASKHSPALNLASAAVAGAITLIRPTRFPRWARRGLSLANTAGTAGAVFLAVRGDDDLPDDHPLHRALTISDLTAAATGGLMLVTSGLGLKADAKVEGFLVRHGVRYPRVVMAAGVVAVLFAVKSIQDATSKHAPDTTAGSNRANSVTTKPANKTLPTTDAAATAPQSEKDPEEEVER